MRCERCIQHLASNVLSWGLGYILTMSVFVVCSQCGDTEEYTDEHAARSDGWAELSIDGVVGPANQSEWTGVCPDHSESK
jgi:hypothetical protein